MDQENWEYDQPPPPDKELDMSDLWFVDDSAPLTDKKKMKYSFTKQPSENLKPSQREKGRRKSSILQRVSFKHGDGGDPLHQSLVASTPAGTKDLLTTDEMQKFRVSVFVHAYFYILYILDIGST